MLRHRERGTHCLPASGATLYCSWRTPRNLRRAHVVQGGFSVADARCRILASQDAAEPINPVKYNSGRCSRSVGHCVRPKGMSVDITLFVDPEFDWHQSAQREKIEGGKQDRDFIPAHRHRGADYPCVPYVRSCCAPFTVAPSLRIAPLPTNPNASNQSSRTCD